MVVRQQIYTRIVQFIHHAPKFHHQNLSDDVRALVSAVSTKEFENEGKSLEAWVAAKLLSIATMAMRSRSFLARFKFRQPIPVQVRGVDLSVSEIEIRAAFTVQWMTQVAEIGASRGMYDYLRRVVVVGPGPHQFHLKNVNSETWGTPIDIEDVPPRLLIPVDQRPDPGIPWSEMMLAMIKNMPQSDPKDAPDLDRFIEAEEVIDEG